MAGRYAEGERQQTEGLPAPASAFVDSTSFEKAVPRVL